MDIGTLAAPLSLLQGFNLTSEQSLDNLVAVANQTFQHNHKALFTRSEFEETCGLGDATILAGLGAGWFSVDEVSVVIPAKTLQKPIRESFAEMVSVLQADGVEHRLNEDQFSCTLSFPGVIAHGMDSSMTPDQFRVSIEPIELPRSRCAPHIVQWRGVGIS